MKKSDRRRTTVLFVVHSLIGGGAERVMVQIINGVDRDRFNPVLALGAAEGPYLGDVCRDVPMHVLGTTRARHATPALIQAVRRVRPDVVLSTAGLNLAVLAARSAFPRGTRVVLREANSPKAFLEDATLVSPRRARMYRAIYRLLYRRADVVICQSDAMVADMAQLGVPRGKLIRIYNPVAVEQVNALAREPLIAPWDGDPRLVSVGRLSHQKGYDILLEAMVAVRARHPGVTLRIFGDGYERIALEQTVSRLGLHHAVTFCGFASNPYPDVSAADVFVSSSRYEGFSNAIVEALACGTPVVATDCPSANREVIEPANGWLATPTDDAAALASTINRALDERRGLSRDAIRRRCTERFSATLVVREYEKVLSP